MRQVIDGLIYDTETATELCEVGSATEYSTNFEYWRAALYKTPKGRYFLHGSGGARSPFARKVERSAWRGGAGIIPLSHDAARAYAEQVMDADDIAANFKTEEA